MTTIQFDKISRVTCGRCGQDVDVSRCRPLTITHCPQCEAEVKVPAAMGELFFTEILGRGSNGVVFQALDGTLGRLVAVKLLDPTAGGDPQRVERCLNEARAMAAVNHPNVVQIHRIAEHRGQSYIEMELMRGGNVGAVIQQDERIDQHRAMRIALEAAEGLRGALRGGLIHHDVKPENLMLDHHGVVKLTDFGAARFDNEPGDKGIVGTPYYVAPEVIREEDVDFRADIYSLGCTLYHMLSGQPPFHGDNVTSVYMAHLREKRPDLCEVNATIHPAVAKLVRKMMRRDPGKRFDDYAQLIDAIVEVRRALDADAVKDYRFPTVMYDTPDDTDAPPPARASGQPGDTAHRPRRRQVPKRRKSATLLMFMIVAMGVAIVGLVILAIWAVNR